MQDEPSLNIERIGDATVIRALPTSITPQAGEALLGYRAFPKGVKMVLDLSGLLFLGSAALSVMIVYHKRVKQAGGRLVVAGLDDECRKVVETAELTKILDLQPDLASALEAVGCQAPAPA